MSKLKLLNMNNESVVLLSALGLIALAALPQIELSSSSESHIDAFEFDEFGEAYPVEIKPKKNNYIAKTKTLLSSNNYSVVKTLYKLQNVIEDLSYLQIADYSTASAQSGDIVSLIDEISPYMSSSKRNGVHELMSKIDKTKTTINQFGRMKEKINSIPPDSPRGERLKTILGELPALTSLPGIGNISQIKNAVDMIKILSQTMGKTDAPNLLSASESDQSNASNEDDNEAKEIMDLMNLFEDRNKSN